MKKILFPFLITLLLVSCDLVKRVQILPQNRPDLVWEAALNDSLELSPLENLVIGNSVVAFKHYKTSDKQNVLMGFNKNTGEFSYLFEDLVEDFRFIQVENNYHSHEGIVAYSVGPSVHGFDVDKGELLWSNTDYDWGKNFNEGFDDIVLHVFQEENSGRHNHVHLGLSDIQTGDWRIIYTMEGTEFWKPEIYSFAVQTILNDTLVYISGSYQNLDSLKGRSFILGYNQTQREEIFYIDEEKISGPIAVNGKYLVVDGEKFRCFDAFSGELIWEQEKTDHFSGKMILTEDKILGLIWPVTTSTLNLYSLETGEEIWSQSFPQVRENFEVHNGVIYGTRRGVLNALNIESGQLLWSLDSLGTQSALSHAFRSPLAIDPATDRLYTTYGDIHVCLQLK